MKKIMKKVLSLALIVAMAIAPMTVMAAKGDAVPVPHWSLCIYSGDTVEVNAGETVFYEMGTNGASGTYDFVVEGTGDFNVSVCSESGDGAYIDGDSIAAVNGKVETQFTSYDSTYGYGCFSITNNTSDTVLYTCSLVFPEGTQGSPKEVTLSVASTANVTVPAGGQYYINAKLPSAGTEYKLTITGNTGFGYVGMSPMPNWDTNGTLEVTVAAYNPGAVASFSLANKTGNDITCTLALA